MLTFLFIWPEARRKDNECGLGAMSLKEGSGDGKKNENIVFVVLNELGAVISQGERAKDDRKFQEIFRQTSKL